MPRRGENIRKRKDGRWEGRYIKSYDLDGKAKYASIYAKSYSEVKKKLNDISKNAYIELSNNKQKTLKDILYLWLENNRIKLKEQTYVKYKRMIETHILPEIGNIEITKVDISYINRIILKKSKGGRLDDKGGLSASYVRTIGFILRSSLSFASQNKYCLPLSGPVSLPVKSKSKLEVFSIQEQNMLEQACIESKDSKRIGILLSLFIGLRIGEVCGLKWSDIDFENHTIHIQRTVERIQMIDSDEKKTKLVIVDTKSISSDRMIPFPSKLLTYLSIDKKDSNEYILKGNIYNYIDPRTLQYYYHKLLENNNIRYINYHALRHTFATRCIESGMDVKSLSEILGHANVNITLTTYVHSSMDHKRKQMEAMFHIYGQTNGQTITKDA